MERLIRIPLDQMPVRREITQDDLIKLSDYQSQGNDGPLSVALLMVDEFKNTEAELEKLMGENFDLDKAQSLDLEDMDRDDMDFFANVLNSSLFIGSFYSPALSYLQARIATGEAVIHSSTIQLHEISGAIHFFYSNIYGPLMEVDELSLEKKEHVDQAELIITPNILAQIYGESADPIQFFEKIIERRMKQNFSEVSNIGFERGKERFIILLAYLPSS